MRIHRSIDTDFHLRVKSKPIVEHTSRVRFSPLSLALMSSESSSGDPREAQVRSLMQQHKLGEETGMYAQVEDFGWIKASHSPNWNLKTEDEADRLSIPWPGADSRSTPLASVELDDDEI